MTSPKEVLDRVVDVVLVYRPPKAQKPKRRIAEAEETKNDNERRSKIPKR